VLEPGRDRRLVAEVARQVDHLHARVGLGEAVEQLGRAVAARVVHEHELEALAAERRPHAVVEDLNGLLLVEHRRHDAHEPGAPLARLDHRRGG
jgi:hypothetical protein